MLQPFILLQQNHMDALEKSGRIYLVTQRYTRGANYLENDDDKIDILITDYSNLGQAEIHYNAKRGNPIKAAAETMEMAKLIEPDKKWTSIIHLNKIEHYQKLQEMLQGNKYRLYWAVTNDKIEIKKMIRSLYATEIFNYIKYALQWPVKGSDKFDIKEGVIFGELIVNLSWNKFKKWVPLMDIQQYKVE